MAEELKTNNMPGKSKKGGGLEVGSTYKMKNSVLHASAKYGSPMQANYGSPATKKTFGEWFKGTKLGKDLKGLGEKIQSTSEKIKTSTPTSRSEAVRDGFYRAGYSRKKATEKRTEQLKKFFIPKKK